MSEFLYTLLVLFWEFFKTGLFAVGGGMATLPFLYQIAEKYDWFTAAQLTDMIAVAESTPGPIGINAATYGGFRAAGVLGGTVATLGLVLPSFIIILLIAGALKRYSDNGLVKDVFATLRPATLGLIAAAGIGLVCSAVYGANRLPSPFALPDAKGWIAAALVILVAALAIKFKKHPVFYIAGGAAVGIVLGYCGILG